MRGRKFRRRATRRIRDRVFGTESFGVQRVPSARHAASIRAGSSGLMSECPGTISTLLTRTRQTVIVEPVVRSSRRQGRRLIQDERPSWLGSAVRLLRNQPWDKDGLETLYGYLGPGCAMARPLGVPPSTHLRMMPMVTGAVLLFLAFIAGSSGRAPPTQ
jgi:hypothetical protein